MARDLNQNLAIWSALERTDPAHTKSFSRGGGFKGTAMRPIYNIKRMTEQFGPCGVGWGMTKPDFETVNGDGELLVFCTVGLWYVWPDHPGYIVSGARIADDGAQMPNSSEVVYGVGGDKVVAKRKDGTFNNDEAFKAAFTDALSNAMKQIGIGADIHMGLFDDDKYVRSVEREFHDDRSPTEDYYKQASEAISNHTDPVALQAWVDANNSHLNALPEEQGQALYKQYKLRMGALSQKPAGNSARSKPAVDLDDSIQY